jgi:hypothetical protein
MGVSFTNKAEAPVVETVAGDEEDFPPSSLLAPPFSSLSLPMHYRNSLLFIFLSSLDSDLT